MSKAPKRAKTLLEHIADMSDPQPKDFDIENYGMDDNAYVGAGSDGDESESDEQDRSHYITMGKSKLRQNQSIGDLGPKYAGSRVSRKDLYGDDTFGLNDEDDDDSDDDGIDNDESEDSSEDEDISSNDEDDKISARSRKMADSDDSDSDSEDGLDGMYNDDDDDDGAATTAAESSNRIRDELKKLEEGEKALLNRITQTAQDDVEKGKHVLNQTRMWEGALDARIRAQKFVTAANELPRTDLFAQILGNGAQMDDESSYKALGDARNSVQQLLGSLIELRRVLIAQNEAAQQSQTGTKRKPQDNSDAIESAWQELEDVRDSFREYRDSSLEKWSNRVQVTANIGAAKKFKAVNQGIMHQIDQTLSTKDRLIERTQLKRAEYNIVGEKTDTADKAESSTVDSHLRNLDSEIFDDTDFYQQLLRELIESRMVDSNDPMAELGTRWSAVKQQTRSKKQNVDTKASKGRKIRYQVMEKLQNFMPPIPAGTWHEDMVNELFSSLLGQSVPQSILDAETNDNDSEDTAAASHAHSSDIVTDIKGLRLFG
ncbi:rRNA-processing protein bfr2 [Coemansia interrupta]|uniref:Protein BFR2 n=1 Tax=Coemansia interrupta TaxID=1126814 RepID=A0A9W8LHZ7_9FUNG|nr:rRNA-processing protein bfr2 [Coemansia interrupta]